MAQSVEQLIRNQQVAGSNPVTSSKFDNKKRNPKRVSFFIVILHLCKITPAKVAEYCLLRKQDLARQDSPSHGNRIPSLVPQKNKMAKCHLIFCLVFWVKTLVHSARVELTTFAVGGQRSIQLSYKCKFATRLSGKYLFFFFFFFSLFGYRNF